MNEEIEYAEMLEIPVSTVSVTEKRRKFRKNRGDLKEKLISKVNDAASADYAGRQASVNDARREAYEFNETAVADEAYAANESDGFEEKAYSEFSTVQIENAVNGEYENGYENAREAAMQGALLQKEGRGYGGGRFARRLVAFEFAAACVLCATIFMTNVFLPDSGMNVFFRSLGEPKTEAPVTKKYSDFTLRSVVNDFAEVPLTVSETGVLTFKGKCCVYPAVDGAIAEIVQNENGTFDVKIAHTNDFYGVIRGLDAVYYETGAQVYANVPVGYTRGENDVQITMYSGEELITSFSVDEENCLVWAQS